MDTITYVANPIDSRCQWFSAIIEPKFLDPKYLVERTPFTYLRRGQDLELEPGTFILNSEAVHHRKRRGFVVHLGVAIHDQVIWIQPTMDIKMLIKQEGHKDLMKGCGDVAACIRMAIYLSRQESLLFGIKKLAAGTNLIRYIEAIEEKV